MALNVGRASLSHGEFKPCAARVRAKLKLRQAASGKGQGKEKCGKEGKEGKETFGKEKNFGI